jgi:hypothetical protein
VTFRSAASGIVSAGREQEQDPDHYTLLAKIPTEAGARTSLFVPNLSRFYLAAPHREDQALKSVNTRCRQ